MRNAIQDYLKLTSKHIRKYPCVTSKDRSTTKFSCLINVSKEISFLSKLPYLVCRSHMQRSSFYRRSPAFLSATYFLATVGLSIGRQRKSGRELEWRSGAWGTFWGRRWHGHRSYYSGCHDLSVCYDDRISDCYRCFSIDTYSLNSCTTFTGACKDVQTHSSDSESESRMEHYRYELDNSTIGEQSAYCFGFQRLLTIDSPDLDIGTTGRIVAEGAGYLLKTHLYDAVHSEVNVQAELLYTAPVLDGYDDRMVRQNRNQGLLRKKYQRRLAGPQRLPTTAEITVSGSEDIRRDAIENSLRDVMKSSRWDDTFSTDPNEYKIVEKDGSYYIVYIPFKESFADSARLTVSSRQNQRRKKLIWATPVQENSSIGIYLALQFLQITIIENVF